MRKIQIKTFIILYTLGFSSMSIGMTTDCEKAIKKRTYDNLCGIHQEPLFMPSEDEDEITEDYNSTFDQNILNSIEPENAVQETINPYLIHKAYSEIRDIPQKDTLTAEEKFTCDECEAWFSKIDFLQRHKKSEHNKEEICECGYKTNNKQHMKRHKKTPHNLTLSCIICNNSFFSQGSLTQHFAYDHPHQNICQKCGFYSENPQTMRSHSNRKHNLDLKCFSCSLYFSSYGARKQHAIAEGHSRRKKPLSKKNEKKYHFVFLEK